MTSVEVSFRPKRKSQSSHTNRRLIFRTRVRRASLACSQCSYNPHSPRHRHRTTSRRDFVHWRFSAAGRISAWKVLRRRRLKTCTEAVIIATQKVSENPCQLLATAVGPASPCAGKRVASSESCERDVPNFCSCTSTVMSSVAEHPRKLRSISLSHKKLEEVHGEPNGRQC